MVNSEDKQQLAMFRETFRVEKVVVPENLGEIIKNTDNICKDENITSLSSLFKNGLPILCAALFNSYKNMINEQRRKALKVMKNNKTGPKARKLSGDGGKIDRESCIPEEYQKCRSPTAMAALTLYCLCNERFRIRKNMLYAALSGEYSSVPEQLRAIRKVQSESNKDKSLATHEEPSADMIPRIVQTLLECAELIKDKGPAKFACELDERAYIKAVDHYLQRQAFKTIYPFEPLKSKYLKGCVGQMFIKTENDKLINQHKVDPQRTIRFMLDRVDSAFSSQSNSGQSPRKTRSATIKFDTDYDYRVFVGPINYQTNITITNYQYKNRVYRIATYNDCLYDVMGSHLEDCNGADQKSDAQLYNGMAWDERLSLLPYRAKIELRSMSGDELNNFRGYATLTISWIEDDLEYSRTVEFRSDKRKTLD